MQGDNPFLLENESGYASWRLKKLANFPRKISEITVSLKALDNFSDKKNALQTSKELDTLGYISKNQLLADKTSFKEFKQKSTFF